MGLDLRPGSFAAWLAGCASKTETLRLYNGDDQQHGRSADWLVVVLCLILQHKRQKLCDPLIYRMDKGLQGFTMVAYSPGLWLMAAGETSSTSIKN
eukprot:328954-Pelagomonas_calceolata.AAC.2